MSLSFKAVSKGASIFFQHNNNFELVESFLHFCFQLFFSQVEIVFDFDFTLTTLVLLIAIVTLRAPSFLFVFAVFHILLITNYYIIEVISIH